MKAHLVGLLISIIVFSQQADAQNTNTDRLKFHYYLTAKKLTKWKQKSVFLTDSAGKKICLCNASKPLKILITTQPDGTLIVDPWKILDSSGCSHDTTRVNYFTGFPLKIISLVRKKVGDPTKVVSPWYTTLVFAANTIQIKFRPRINNAYSYNTSPGVVKSQGNPVPASVAAGAVNLGLSFGYSIGYTNFTHRSANSFSATGSLGFNLSSTALKNEPLKDSLNSNTPLPNNNLVFSPSVSVIVAWNDVGLILAYGYDFMAGGFHSAWSYQGKRFFGLGLSLGFKL